MYVRENQYSTTSKEFENIIKVKCPCLSSPKSKFKQNLILARNSPVPCSICSHQRGVVYQSQKGSLQELSDLIQLASRSPTTINFDLKIFHAKIDFPKTWNIREEQSKVLLQACWRLSLLDQPKICSTSLPVGDLGPWSEVLVENKPILPEWR